LQLPEHGVELSVDALHDAPDQPSGTLANHGERLQQLFSRRQPVDTRKNRLHRRGIFNSFSDA